MNEHRKTSIRLVIGHIMAALSQALFISAPLAMLIHPFFHGYLVRTDTGNSHWVHYFAVGGFRVDARIMFAAFVVAFIVLPVVLGVWLASRTTQSRFQTIGASVGFGLLIAVALAFNGYVALVYLVTNWNSSQPF